MPSRHRLHLNLRAKYAVVEVPGDDAVVEEAGQRLEEVKLKNVREARNEVTHEPNAFCFGPQSYEHRAKLVIVSTSLMSPPPPDGGADMVRFRSSAFLFSFLVFFSWS